MLPPDPDLADPFCLPSHVHHEEAFRILNEFDFPSERSRTHRSARDGVISGIPWSPGFSTELSITCRVAFDQFLSFSRERKLPCQLNSGRPGRGDAPLKNAHLSFHGRGAGYSPESGKIRLTIRRARRWTTGLRGSLTKDRGHEDRRQQQGKG